MVQQIAAGVYAYLPLGWRVLRKIEAIVREEMNAAGGQELLMPVLQPIELWEETGRASALGEVLMRLRDRRERILALGPTHEEVISVIVRSQVQSYRDLPVLAYQIQNKFRDEPRPRGGLIRGREFIMKDLYSFDVDYEGLDESYGKMVRAYQRIYERCCLSAIMVEADSGAIGGKESHEFIVLAPTGEDTVIYCEHGDYAANAERAEMVKKPLPKEEPLSMEEVHTPGIKTIEELASFLRISPAKTLKAVFYVADREFVFVTIRGDLEVNEVKLKNALKATTELRLATDEEVREVGLVPGSASLVGVKGLRSIADDSILLGSNLVAGGNKPDTHIKNVNYPRDFKVDKMADIALARAGDECVRCGGVLVSTRGIEVGHVFKLGTIYSEKLGVTYLDRDGQQKPIVMGCYGFGVSRLMAAAIEQNHDERGITWPLPIAPYHFHLCALSMDNPEVADAAEALYREMLDAGLEVLYDDRLESPGVKFNDADLLGIPFRLTISPRTLKAKSVELKPRQEKETVLVPREELVPRLKALTGRRGAVA